MLGIISQISQGETRRPFRNGQNMTSWGSAINMNNSSCFILGKAVPSHETQTWMDIDIDLPCLSLSISVVSAWRVREAKLDPGGRVRVGLSSTMVAIVAMAVANWWCPIANEPAKVWESSISNALQKLLQWRGLRTESRDLSWFL